MRTIVNLLLPFLPMVEECERERLAAEEEADADYQDMVMRAAIGTSLSCLIIIIVLIIFCVTRNK